MRPNRDIEDREDLTGGFHDITGYERADSNTCKHAALSSGKSDGTLGGLCTVGGVGVGNGHTSDEGAT